MLLVGSCWPSKKKMGNFSLSFPSHFFFQVWMGAARDRWLGEGVPTQKKKWAGGHFYSNCPKGRLRNWMNRSRVTAVALAKREPISKGNGTLFFLPASCSCFFSFFVPRFIASVLFFFLFFLCLFFSFVSFSAAVCASWLLLFLV